MCFETAFLTATRWTLTVDSPEFKGFSLSLHAYSHPSVTREAASQSNAIVDAPHIGSKIVYDVFTAQSKVDENLEIYQKLHEWLIDPVGKYHDITVIFYDGNEQPSKQIVFHDAFPTSVGMGQFNSQDANDSLVSMDVTFDYSKFVIKDV